MKTVTLARRGLTLASDDETNSEEGVLDHAPR